VIIENTTITINADKSIKIKKLEIPDHGIIGIFGKSGTGKSTLLNHLHHGKLNKYIGNNISYMSQENLFFEYMTVKENIVFQLSLVNQSMNLKNKIFTDFNIIPLLNKKPKELSVGERQRIDFSIQILRDTKVILLDEPTASLNDYYVDKIIEYLKYKKEEHLIIITSHNPRISEICDSIYNIKDNCLINIKQNNYDNLLKNDPIKIDLKLLRFISIKFKREFIKKIPVYLIIGIICTGVTLMHSIKYQMLDTQTTLLNSISENEILLLNSEDPYTQTFYDNCLPIEETNWEKLCQIDGIKCYPLYYITNTDSDSVTHMAHIYQDSNEILSFNGTVAIIPYTDTQWIKDNLISGEETENGIYLNSRIGDYKIISQDNLSIDVEVMVPTHYSIMETTHDELDDEESYSWDSAFLMGDIVEFNENISGIIDENYYSSSGAQTEIYVPYEMVNQIVKEHQTDKEKEFYGTMMKPYTFGAAYIEVEELGDIENIDKQIQQISKNFQTSYEYTNHEKILNIYKNFKNEIDLFEYIVVIFSILLSYGYWKTKEQNDALIKHKLVMYKLSKKQYLQFYFLDSLIDTFLILIITFIMSYTSFHIILSIGESLFYDQNTTIAAIISSFILCFIMKMIIERKLLYDRNK
jgi:ABC-type lipoprotein export system ATPase subunit